MQKTVNSIRQTLSHIYDERETRAICDLILEEICSISRTERIMNPDLILPEEKCAQIAEICTMLATGMPVQQAIGYEYFLGRKFLVNKDVLIPRPETAELVQWVVEMVEKDRSLSILDIGTGSGCIALSLAALINNSQVFAADLSTAALDIAKQNAEGLDISNIEFVQMDILSECNKRFQHLNVEKFDIIVSNPPYVMNKEKEEMCKNVLDFEPHLALFVPDDDPLLFYRAIAQFGKLNLHDGGLLFFEINAALGKETCELLENFGYKDIELRQDINGRDRMIKARYEDS